MLTVGLAFFQQQMSHGGKFTVLMAGALVSILPLLIVFFFAQKLFIEGIALSGVGMEGDVLRSHEAGFAAHLVKPVNLNDLQSAIQRIAQS